MDLWEIKAEIAADMAESADSALLELGLLEWSILEDAIARRAWIVGIFEGESQARSAWTALMPILAACNPAVPAIRALGPADWRDSYKAHFKAWAFGRLHWVPIWEKTAFQGPPGSAVLWLDPGLAFGTGNHETTRLCIERLIEIDEGMLQAGRRTVRVVDAGCGSGILALSASLLGFPSVEAFDNDPEAVRVSLENAALNGMDGKVHFFAADVAEGLRDRQAGLVLANIQSDILIANAAVLIRAVTPGGHLILSGILEKELESVKTAFSTFAPSWTATSRTLGEWSGLFLQRPA